MADSQPMNAERQVQRSFTKTLVVQLLTLAAAVLLFGWWVRGTPDRSEVGWRTAILRFHAVELDPAGFGDLRLAGAWSVTSDDPRFGGISALANDAGRLIALTDAGAVVRFDKPVGESGRALIGELPDGPGDPRFKMNRDSEALVLDPAGRGWWVAFENSNELWLYDKALSRTLGRVPLGGRRWRHNAGIEAALTAGNRIVLLPELGRAVVHFAGSSLRSVPIVTPAGPVSDAATLASGELMVVNRSLGPLGFSNSLATLRLTPRGYSYGGRTKLGVGRLDNVEAIAIEPLPGGRVRLWLMTDDNYQRPFRTLLVALDAPARRRERQRPSLRPRA